MQVRFFPFVILIAGLLLACAQKQTVTTTKTAPTPPTEPQTKGHYDGPRFGGPGKTDSLFFSMERTPCFGQCKAYRINVYRSGYATFEGRSNVELEGMHFGHVGKDTLATLLREAEKIQFFELEDKYDSNVTDLPSSIIRIVGGNRDKRVYARVGTPAKFRSYFEQAEGLLFPLPWHPLPAQE